MKRLAAPKHWMLSKMTGTFAPKPRSGPHKTRECVPLMVILRDRLKYALSYRECLMIVKQRFIKVDGKIRRDHKFPIGMMDVITMERTDDKYRVVYDHKGRFSLVPIKAEDTKMKLCKVKNVRTETHRVPALCTHDGRTIRYPDPLIKVNDTVVLDLETNKIKDFVRFRVGNQAICTSGQNVGRVGEVIGIEKHPGGFDIVHLKDKADNTFTTRSRNVFIIGRGGEEPMIQLPRAAGVRSNVVEERQVKLQRSKQIKRDRARAAARK
jgi:small subunit ribosomal protein S4e